MSSAFSSATFASVSFQTSARRGLRSPRSMPSSLPNFAGACRTLLRYSNAFFASSRSSFAARSFSSAPGSARARRVAPSRVALVSVMRIIAFSPSFRTGRNSGEDVLDDVSVDIGQAAVDAVVADGQLLVIDAEQVQDGRVQVVAVRLALGGLVAELVAGAVGHAGLDAGAGEPGDERPAVMVAASCPLCERHAAELGRPD